MSSSRRSSRPPEIGVIVADRSLRASLAMLLSAYGCIVHEFRRPEDYFACVPISPLRCLVVDSTPEARRACRRLVWSSIPVVMLSPWPDPPAKPERSCPGVRFVPGPWDGEALVRTVLEAAGAAYAKGGSRAAAS